MHCLRLQLHNLAQRQQEGLGDLPGAQPPPGQDISPSILLTFT